MGAGITQHPLSGPVANPGAGGRARTNAPNNESPPRAAALERHGGARWFGPPAAFRVRFAMRVVATATDRRPSVVIDVPRCGRGGRRRTWVAGTPIPTPDRAGAGLAVVDGSAWVLVDCGRAVTQGALQAGLDLTALVSFASRIITLTTSAISPPWRRPAGPPARRRRWRPSGRRPGRPNVASASLTSPSMVRRAAVPGIARPSPSTRSLRLRPPPPLPLGMAG
jgi:hypothetical protein